MTLLERRRAIMAKAEEEAPYLDGWTQGKYVMSTGNIANSSYDYLSPKMAVVGGNQLKWYKNSTVARCAQFYNGDTKVKNYAMEGEKTVNVPSTATSVQLSLPKATIDDCYVIDLTTNKYLFKGKNV